MQRKSIKLVSWESDWRANARVMIYASPCLPMTTMFTGITYVQGIFATYSGVPVSVLAVVLMLGRLFDAVSDPIVGFLSDQAYRKTGSRKSFVVAGGVIFTISAYFFFVPFGWVDKQDSVSGAYLLFWLIAFYIGWTMFEVPHLAWGSELMKDAKESSKVFSVRAFSIASGSLLFFAVPLLPVFQTQDITPETLRVTVLIGAVMMMVSLTFCVRLPSEFENQNSHPQKVGSAQLSVREYGRLLLGNFPFLLLLAGFIFVGFGIGMWFALIFIYADSYLGIGESYASIFLLSAIASIGSIALWFKLARTIGNAKALALGMSMIVVGVLAIGFQSPNSSSLLAIFLAVSAVKWGLAALNVIVPSMVSEIIDYGALKFGAKRPAIYYSAYTFMGKANMAFGGAAGLALVAAFGYDPLIHENSEAAITGLKIASSIFPGVFVLGGLALFLINPINSTRYEIIRKRLEMLERRANGPERPLVAGGCGVINNSEK